MVILWWKLSCDEIYLEMKLVMKVMIVKEVMTGDVSPVAMFLFNSCQKDDQNILQWILRLQIYIGFCLSFMQCGKNQPGKCGDCINYKPNYPLWWCFVPSKLLVNFWPIRSWDVESLPSVAGIDTDQVMIAFEPNNFPPKWVEGTKSRQPHWPAQTKRQERQLSDGELSISPTFPCDPVSCTEDPLKLMIKGSKHDWGPVEKCVGKLKQPSMKSPGASLEHLQKSYDPLLMYFVDV